MTAWTHSGHVFDIFDFDTFESCCIAETIQESSASLATSLVSEWRVSASIDSIDDVPFDPVNPVPHSSFGNDVPDGSERSCGTPVVRVPTLHAESPRVMKDSVSYLSSLCSNLWHIFLFPAFSLQNCLHPPVTTYRNIWQLHTFLPPPLLALNLRLHCCLCCDVCEMPLEPGRVHFSVSVLYSLMPLLATCIGKNRSQLVSAFPGYIVRSSCAIWKSRNDVLVPRSCVEMFMMFDLSTWNLWWIRCTQFFKVPTALSRCVPHPDLSSLVVHLSRFWPGFCAPKMPQMPHLHLYWTRTDQVCGISGVRGWSLMICSKAHIDFIATDLCSVEWSDCDFFFFLRWQFSMLFVAPGPKAGLETTGNCFDIQNGECEGTSASLIQADLAQADTISCFRII